MSKERDAVPLIEMTLIESTRARHRDQENARTFQITNLPHRWKQCVYTQTLTRMHWFTYPRAGLRKKKKAEIMQRHGRCITDYTNASTHTHTHTSTHARTHSLSHSLMTHTHKHPHMHTHMHTHMHRFTIFLFDFLSLVLVSTQAAERLLQTNSELN